ncbi:Cyclohexadienyl dehydrogenase [hydrothermal vent metagenome]|uniref:Cyclohexadienyl dehydrogenase n=1 Tax=hydrothermal vent metagenome TaxID=652676 RepID=A0A3B0Z8T5_9ZZZZ
MSRILIIGVGLIGGSLARALKRVHYCDEIVGYGRNHFQLQRAVELGVVDRFETNLMDAVQGVDLIVVAVPLGSMFEVFHRLAELVDAGTVITDVGSAKGSVTQAARTAFGDVKFPFFVPGHPVAGTENSGVDASFAELYDQRRVLLTPVVETDPAAVQQVELMWRAAGAVVEMLAVDHHDDVLAATSHLPHILAYTLVDVLVKMDDSEEIFRYAAGGFRDFTRIASSDPQMWTDIVMGNKAAILPALDQYIEHVTQLRATINRSDENALTATFSRAKAARDRYSGKES